MNPPPNPHDDEARTAMRQAIRPILVNPPPDADPPPPDLSAALDRLAATWPAMLRYADTARVEPLHHPGGW